MPWGKSPPGKNATKKQGRKPLRCKVLRVGDIIQLWRLFTHSAPNPWNQSGLHTQVMDNLRPILNAMESAGSIIIKGGGQRILLIGRAHRTFPAFAAHFSASPKGRLRVWMGEAVLLVLVHLAGDLATGATRNGNSLVFETVPLLGLLVVVFLRCSWGGAIPTFVLYRQGMPQLIPGYVAAVLCAGLLRAAHSAQCVTP